MSKISKGSVAAAVKDLHDGIGHWQLWNLLASNDIKQRYRRSTLGPLWITVTMAVQMVIMGVLFTALFGSSFAKMLPYVSAGLLFWGLIHGILNEGAATFVGAAGLMVQVKRPFSLYIMQTVWRNVFILAHNFIIFIVIAIIYKIVPSPTSIWLWPAGLVLVALNLTWMALIAAIISTRYRDFPMIVQNVLSALFWLTPLMFFPSQLGKHAYLLDYNPFTHMVALLREPLLGNSPSLLNWVATAMIAMVGWGAAILCLARTRDRIAYWL